MRTGGLPAGMASKPVDLEPKNPVMTGFDLLIDFHREADRQGPGSPRETRKALGLLELDGSEELQIADIGCGTGDQTLTLARHTRGQITAVDLVPEFLDRLNTRAAKEGLSHRIHTRAQAMETLSFPPDSLDLIWSEGAIYIMGFAAGLQGWRPFLKPGGHLVVSELSWLTADRPAELEAYWDEAYPQIDTISGKIRLLEGNGFLPKAHFILHASCWTDHYYGPMQARFQPFLARHHHSEEARALVGQEREEIRLYERYQAYYGYVFYIGQKLGEV